MKSLFLIAFLASFSTPTNADMQSLLDNWKRYNETVIDLKNNPQKYGLQTGTSNQVDNGNLNQVDNSYLNQVDNSYLNQVDNSYLNQVAPKDLRTIDAVF